MSGTCFYVVIVFDGRLRRQRLNRPAHVWGGVEPSNAADGSEFGCLAGFVVFVFFKREVTVTLKGFDKEV